MELLLLSSLLIGLDWGQTNANINKAPIYNSATGRMVFYTEENFALGLNPTNRQVNQYFVGALVANAGIGFMLPKKYRNTYWKTVSIYQAGITKKNDSIGISATFKFK